MMLLAMLNAYYIIHLVILLQLLIACGCNGERLFVVMVGREGNDLKLRFSPEQVFADVGDRVQFQFYPLNHSAVQADFNNPCIPIDNSTGKGFFSGFHPLPLNTEIVATFTINVTSPDPIFFYCSQGRHCQHGFIGAINPTAEQSLEKFREAASKAPQNLSPGEVSSLRTETTPPQRGGFHTGFNFTNADNDKTITNVGAIVGGVLGGVAFFVILVTFGVFLIARRRNGSGPPAAKVKYKISKPEIVENNVGGGSGKLTF
ncbi:hypothetical protein DFP73DRAFT_548977 [Morchella snyderi]|nr:hypothetical protein DFP73DRAFT_548977 [Morchella snyderi]